MAIGTQLAQARAARKLSIGEVSRETKIQPWVLEALEADRLQELMSPIYVKGFLGQYARFLRVEPEPLLAQLSWPQEPAHEEEPVHRVPILPTRPAFQIQIPWERLKRLRGPVLIGAGVVALIVVKPLRWLPALPVLHRPASVSVISEPAPSVSAKSLSTIPSLELSIAVRRPTWVRVRADGKLLTQQHLPGGTEETWTAKERFEVIVAKPLQVEVMLNGQSISPLAVAHRGRLLITPRGVHRLPEEAF